MPPAATIFFCAAPVPAAGRQQWPHLSTRARALSSLFSPSASFHSNTATAAAAYYLCSTSATSRTLPAAGGNSGLTTRASNGRSCWSAPPQKCDPPPPPPPHHILAKITQIFCSPADRCSDVSVRQRTSLKQQRGLVSIGEVELESAQGGLLSTAA